MKKLREVPGAWKNGTESDPGWEKDSLIHRLESEGHATISVDRAVLIIEQCERGDAFPGGWSADPLKITVFPDPDAGFGPEPQELFVHAGRYGLMDVLVRDRGRELRMVALEREAANGAIFSHADLVRVDAIERLVRGGLAGCYQVHHVDEATGRARDGKDVRGEFTTTKHDARLAQLGARVVQAIAEYRKHLDALPGLFRSWNRGGDPRPDELEPSP